MKASLEAINHVITCLVAGGLDLKDAYFAVPIHKNHCRFLELVHGCMLATSTGLKWQACSHVQVPVPHIWSDFIPQNICQDTTASGRSSEAPWDQVCDFPGRLVHNGTGTLLQTWAAIDLLEALGFLVSFKKSVVKPSQAMEYLGFLINSIWKEIRLPAKKLNQIRRDRGQTIIGSAQVSARTLARFIGKLSA